MPRSPKHHRIKHDDHYRTQHSWDLLTRVERVRLARAAGFIRRAERVANLVWPALSSMTRTRLQAAGLPPAANDARLAC